MGIIHPLRKKNKNCENSGITIKNEEKIVENLFDVESKLKEECSNTTKENPRITITNEEKIVQNPRTTTKNEEKIVGEDLFDVDENTEIREPLFISSPYFFYEPIKNRILEITSVSDSITFHKDLPPKHEIIFPDDLLKLIFMKLKLFELWAASLVCQNWYQYLIFRRYF